MQKSTLKFKVKTTVEKEIVLTSEVAELDHMVQEDPLTSENIISRVVLAILGEKEFNRLIRDLYSDEYNYAYNANEDLKRWVDTAKRIVNAIGMDNILKNLEQSAGSTEHSPDLNW